MWWEAVPEMNTLPASTPVMGVSARGTEAEAVPEAELLVVEAPIHVRESVDSKRLAATAMTSANNTTTAVLIMWRSASMEEPAAVEKKKGAVKKKGAAERKKGAVEMEIAPTTLHLKAVAMVSSSPGVTTAMSRPSIAKTPVGGTEKMDFITVT